MHVQIVQNFGALLGFNRQETKWSEFGGFETQARHLAKNSLWTHLVAPSGHFTNTP
jgi:hypothetical protein